MADLNDFYKIDAVDDVMAEDINRLIASSDYSLFTNVETLSADKDLVDDDCPIQMLIPSGANKNVILPDEADTNHKFLIANPSASSYSLIVKTFGSVSTLATLTAGQAGVFYSTGSEYFVSGAGQTLSKALFSDVATGTDDAKYVTSKAIKDSVNVPNVAPSTTGNVLTSNGSAWTSAAPAVTLDNTVTFTNKRITPRITTITSASAPTINTDDCDAVTITALAATITSMTTNLSGTPTNFQKLIIRIKDNGTARGITWGAKFASRGVTLPTTTIISKVLTVGFLWNSVTSTWDCVAMAEEA